MVPRVCSLSLMMVICCATQCLGNPPARDNDMIEFESIEDAAEFGWKPTEDAELVMAGERKVGGHALAVRPTVVGRPYRGLEFVRNVDLHDARPSDTLAFYVKQNYGTDMVVQIWTDEGNVHRAVPLDQGRWTRVELDLDLGSWENPDHIRWGRVNSIRFYSRSFASRDQYMIIDGVSLLVDGKPVVLAEPVEIGRWSFPQVKPGVYLLGNEEAAWAVSAHTGQVVGGWNVATQARYLAGTESRYHLETRSSHVVGLGSQDRVVESEFAEDEQRLELLCTNPQLPGLTIRKTYWLRDHKLFSRRAFGTEKKELQFITYNDEVAFDQDYHRGSYYMGAAAGGGPLIPAPEVVERQKVTEYKHTTKGMVLLQPDTGYGFAQLRMKLDDQFVWPWFTGAINNYCEPQNILYYTPRGWDMSLGTSRLSPEGEVAYEQFLSIFHGDWQTFFRSEFADLPEVQEALEEIPPVPDWVADVKLYTGSEFDRLRRIVEMTDEGIIMVLIDVGGSWADYYVDQGLEGGWEGGSVTGEELRDTVARIKALSPRVKVGLYMWDLSALWNTRIYKEHPEWFRTTNKQGQTVSTFPGYASNYIHLLSIPEANEELLSQFDLVLDYLDTDFIYLDDPKAVNPVDWASGEYTRDDLSFEHLLSIKRIAAEHGPDKVVFFNNRGNPYGDINFIEARGALRADYWRKFTGIGAVIQEFLSAIRPQARIIPLYYISPIEREYVNRVLSLGWIPELEYGDPLERRAFVQAAYEIGNSRSASVDYRPDWKLDENTELESYAIRRANDSGYLLSFISHYPERRTVPIHVNLESLDLDRGENVYVWQYAVEDASQFTGIATERLVRDVYAQTSWQLDRVTRRKLVYSGPFRPEITLELEADPLLLYQYYVTGEPGAVYSQDNLPVNYLFARTPKVAVKAASSQSGQTLALDVESRREQAEIIVYLPASTHHVRRVLVGGQAVLPRFVWEDQDVFPLVPVGQGEHRVELEYEPVGTAAPSPQPVLERAEVAADAVVAIVSGCDAAVLTIEKDGRLLSGHLVKRSADGFRLPLPGARPEEATYRLTLRAVQQDQGPVRLTPPVSVDVQLPAAHPRLELSPDRPKIPGKREIVEVDRQVKGVHVLRSAVETTATPRGLYQPDLPAIMAAVDADDLVLEAGTTRKIDLDIHGAAFAGIEVEKLRKVKVRLSNTFHDALHSRGEGKHTPNRSGTSNFAGIVVDYHTPDGYTKRVRLAVGVIHPECTSVYPSYGKPTEADAAIDLGEALIQTPQTTFNLDLSAYAPPNWDGRVWFSVGTHRISPDRRLKIEVLAANEQVDSGGHLTGVDMHAYKAAYDKPRTLEVPRYPGGIVIDGALDDEMWQGAAKTETFFLQGGSGVSDAKTEAMMLYDDEHLYLAFECSEPGRDRPLVLGGPVWNDDEVEVWIDANGDRKTFRQVIVNAANEVGEYSEAGQVRIGVVSAVDVQEGRGWTVEMTLPFAGLGVAPPKPGEQWRLSLCRYRPPAGDVREEQIVWAPLQTGAFDDLANFGTMIFK